MRLLIRLRRHSHTEWLQLVIGLRAELPKGGIVAFVSQRFDERCIELAEPLDERIARFSSNAPRARPRRVQLADGGLQYRVQRSIGSGPKRRQPGDHAVEVRGQTRSRTGKVRATHPTRPT